MGSRVWWKECLERSKSPERDTAVRLNVRHADGSRLDIDGPFSKKEADELTELAIKFATARSAVRRQRGT